MAAEGTRVPGDIYIELNNNLNSNNLKLVKSNEAYLSDPSGADLTLGLVFLLLQLWFSSSSAPVHTKRHSGLPYCRGGQRSEMW